MKRIRVRRARAEDCAKIKSANVASVRGLCSGHYTPSQIAAWTSSYRIQNYFRSMAAGNIVFVAADGERIAGVSCLSEGKVRAVYVHPGYIGKGIGTKLLMALERAAQRKGLKRLELDSSLNAVPFYKRHNYRVVRRVTHTLRTGCKLSCMKMSKPLDYKGSRQR